MDAELMIHSCTIENSAGETINGKGIPVRAYEAPVTSICRLEARNGKEVYTERNGEALISNHLLFLPATVTITEQAKVTINAEVYEVLFVNPIYDDIGVSHIEADLVRVR